MPGSQRQSSTAADRRPSGSFALHYARTLYDDGVLVRNSLSLPNLAPGGAAHLHPSDAKKLGVTEGARLSIRSESGTAVLPVALDPSLVPGVVYVPFNQPGVPSLGDGPAVDLEMVEGVSA